VKSATLSLKRNVKTLFYDNGELFGQVKVNKRNYIVKYNECEKCWKSKFKLPRQKNNTSKIIIEITDRDNNLIKKHIKRKVKKAYISDFNYTPKGLHRFKGEVNFHGEIILVEAVGIDRADVMERSIWVEALK